MNFETVEKARLAYAEKLKRGFIIGVVILAVIITIGMSSGGGIGIVKEFKELRELRELREFKESPP